MDNKILRLVVVLVIIGMALIANHWAVYAAAILALVHIFVPQVTAVLTVYGIIVPILFTLKIINPSLEERIVSKLRLMFLNLKNELINANEPR